MGPAPTKTQAYRVCVFCSAQKAPKFETTAREFGQGLARRGWEMVFGAGQVGLMGVFANSALAEGGVVRGSITHYLAAGPEVVHPSLTEIAFVDDLMERKKWMMERSDAFVIFPGGYGTLDEALEVLTWKVLGQHQKPVLFVNLQGFWQSQIRVFEELSREGMIHPDALRMYEVCDSLDALWSRLEAEALKRP